MTILTKTQKGQDEIDQRSGSLPLRARRLLILIDGRRDRNTLEQMLGDAAFAEALDLLATQGYVELAATAAMAPPAADPEPSGTTGAVPPAAKGAEQLEVARNFMMNTLRTFNGPYAKLGLIQRIHSSSQRSELLALFEEWQRSIMETAMGRKRADELSARLQAVI